MEDNKNTTEESLCTQCILYLKRPYCIRKVKCLHILLQGFNMHARFHLYIFMAQTTSWSIGKWIRSIIALQDLRGQRWGDYWLNVLSYASLFNLLIDSFKNQDICLCWHYYALVRRPISITTEIILFSSVYSWYKISAFLLIFRYFILHLYCYGLFLFAGIWSQRPAAGAQLHQCLELFSGTKQSNFRWDLSWCYTLTIFLYILLNIVVLL